MQKFQKTNITSHFDFNVVFQTTLFKAFAICPSAKINEQNTIRVFSIVKCALHCAHALNCVYIRSVSVCTECNKMQFNISQFIFHIQTLPLNTAPHENRTNIETTQQRYGLCQPSMKIILK